MLARQFKDVVLVSGGLDSFIAYRLFKTENPKDTLGLFVDLGQPYVMKEMESLRTLGMTAIRRIVCPIISSRYENVPTPNDQIIPGRNMLLATIAASYGQHIWISALKGEMHEYMVDKNQTFFEMATDTLSYSFGKIISVSTPWAHFSKAEMVRYALDQKICTVDEIRRTSTCYDAKVQNCGKCSTCVKRKVALVLNGIEENYVVDPFKTDEGKVYLAKHQKALEDGDYSHYSEQRCLETVRAYSIANGNLEPRLKKE